MVGGVGRRGDTDPFVGPCRPTVADGADEAHEERPGSTGWSSAEGEPGYPAVLPAATPQHPSSRQPKAAPASGPRARPLRGRVRQQSGSGAGAEREWSKGSGARLRIGKNRSNSPLHPTPRYIYTNNDPGRSRRPADPQSAFAGCHAHRPLAFDYRIMAPRSC